MTRMRMKQMQSSKGSKSNKTSKSRRMKGTRSNKSKSVESDEQKAATAKYVYRIPVDITHTIQVSVWLDCEIL